MASSTHCTWVWVNPGSWWWTGRPGVLQSMGLQRVRHDWTSELNWLNWADCFACSSSGLCELIFPAQFLMSWCMLSCFSHVLPFTTPWTVAHQASLSTGYSRQEYWSGLPYLPPGGSFSFRDRTHVPVSPALQADSLPLAPLGKDMQFMQMVERIHYFMRELLSSFAPSFQPNGVCIFLLLWSIK